MFGPRWAAEHGFSMDEVNAMRHMFDGNQISDSAIQAAMKADSMVSSINEVGNVTNRPFQNDMVLHPNTIDANGNPIYTTYANGASPFEVVTHVEDIVTPIDVTTLTPTDVPWAMATFGNYNKRHQAKLKDRPGSKADKIDHDDPEPTASIAPDSVLPPESEEQDEPELLAPVTPTLELPQNLEQQDDPELLAPVTPTLELPQNLERKTVSFPDYVEPRQLTEGQNKRKFLRVSRADAYDIWAKEKDILREQEKLKDQKIQGTAREKIKVRLKKWQQELSERKKLLGNPSQDTLDDAMYWVFRKEDLQKAKEELDELQKRKITPNTSKYDKQEIENKTAKLIAKIAEYESEIPDETYFYDPSPVQYDKEFGTKVPTFKEGMKQLRKLIEQQESNKDKGIIYIDTERQ